MCQNPLIGDNYVARFLCLYPLRYLFAHIVVICLDASTNVLGPMCVDTFNGLTGSTMKLLGYRVYSEYTATGIAIPFVYRNLIAALTRQSILYNRATHPQTQQKRQCRFNAQQSDRCSAHHKCDSFFNA